MKASNPISAARTSECAAMCRRVHSHVAPILLLTVILSACGDGGSGGGGTPPPRESSANASLGTPTLTGQAAYIKAPNADADDQFGWSVALSGDTLAVGAIDEASAATGIDGDQSDNTAGLSGAVYVFTRNAAGVWSQQAYLKASNTDANDQFGWSISLSGDTLAVGAPLEASAATGIDGDQSNDNANSSGAVYVFTRDGAGAWSQQAYIKASNTDANDQFGWSIALSGDTLVVGAPLEASAATGIDGDQSNNNANSSGAVYVFTRDGAGVWSQQAYIKASNTDANDQFGWSIALSGDTLAVGAIDEASAATGIDGDQSDRIAPLSGAVYVFTRDGAGAWSQQAYVKASNTDANDRFGRSIALLGDTLAAGAVGESSAATGIDGDQSDNSAGLSGAVYLFTRDGAGAWSQQAYIKASNTFAGDIFGRTVALSGDTLTVGAPFEDSAATRIDGDQSNNNAEFSGAVYVFTRDGVGAWSQQAYVKASNADANDQFGRSIALSDDTLTVGAHFEDSATTGIDGDRGNNDAGLSGAVYEFTRDGAGVWSQQAYVKASNTDANDRFGHSVALSGVTLAVGAPFEASVATGIDGDQSNNDAGLSGAVYVFE